VLGTAFPAPGSLFFGDEERKMRYLTRTALPAAVAAALLIHSVAPALAALGADEASVELDRAKLQGEVNVTAGAGFTVREIQLPTRTVLREYVSPAGKVFAVTWHGPVIPDLQQILGAYYQPFKAATAGTQRSADHHHQAIDQADLVVRTSGQMRSHHGLIYVPSLLPQNVTLSDIK